MREIYIVESISTFKHKYAIETESFEEALSIAKNNTEDEATQEFMGEEITKVHVSSVKEYLQIFDEVNTYLIDWTKKEKVNLIIGYTGEVNES